MDSKAQNLLRKAGKLMGLGKLALALQLYIKIHELDPQDPTIINTIGDLYLRLGEKDEALIWYQELAEIFESNQRLSSAIATYKKILKLSPHNLDLLTHLAQLHERSGQTSQAKAQYREIARQWSSLLLLLSVRILISKLFWGRLSCRKENSSRPKDFFWPPPLAILRHIAPR